MVTPSLFHWFAVKPRLNQRNRVCVHIMSALGGPEDLTNAVKAAGRRVGPRSVWITSGVERYGFGFLDTFFAGCKASGLTPLVAFWIFGDAISTAAIKSGVNDKYQRLADGSPIFVTAAKAEAWARIVAQKAKAAGVNPIIAIEPEATKNGIDRDASAFAPYFDRIHAAIKAEHPSARTAFCSAIWVSQSSVASLYAPQIAKADLVALQTVLFAPRHGVDLFRGAGPRLSAAFTALRGTTQKPLAVIDLLFSTYGGAYAPTPPFAGGDGRSNEALQVEALNSVASAVTGMGVEFVVYRALKDAPNFSEANYGGWAEKFAAVVRADGTQKPGFAALLALADLLPPPLTRTETEYSAVVNQLNVALAKNVILSGRIDAVKAIINQV